jgi:hypothetical protein
MDERKNSLLPKVHFFRPNVNRSHQNTSRSSSIDRRSSRRRVRFCNDRSFSIGSLGEKIWPVQTDERWSLFSFIKGHTSIRKNPENHELIKSGCDIDDSVKEEKPSTSAEQSLIMDPLVSELSINRLQLEGESRKVAVYIAGLIAKKISDQKKHYCCVNFLKGRLSADNPDHTYIQTLSRGGLTIPSSELTEYVCTAFAILQHTENIIRSSELDERKAASVMLKHVFSAKCGSTPRFTCGSHRTFVEMYANRVLINIFLNNRRKVLTGSVVKDKVKSFKKSKRTKDEK